MLCSEAVLFIDAESSLAKLQIYHKRALIFVDHCTQKLVVFVVFLFYVISPIFDIVTNLVL